MKYYRFGLLLTLFFLTSSCCSTFSGYGRYELKPGCDSVEIAGQSHQVIRSGTSLLVDNRTLTRGVNRDSTPWLYFHHDDGNKVDITFDIGTKDIYPLHTGISASIFAVYDHPWEMTRSTNAAFENNYWLVSHRWSDDEILFDLQQRVGDVTQWQLVTANIFVPDDGTEVVVPEINTGIKILSFDSSLNKATLQFRRVVSQSQIPVLFVHGHSRSAQEAWQTPGNGTTSFDAAINSNQNLSIVPFYLTLPLHGSSHPENNNRSIVQDAEDILAEIEGGADSNGVVRPGILNMPEYQGNRVVIVAYSQGSLSSRYYIKNLMGSRLNGAITISEFVTLAAPNHGIGGSVTCGNEDEPDLAKRQMCGGLNASLLSQGANCGSQFCQVDEFNTNNSNETTFLSNLNNHSFSDNCQQSFSEPEEAPFSKPTNPNGILYVNLYVENNLDLFVGGHTQSLDCAGRRLARNHAPDAVNMEITGISGEVHSKFPHHLPTVCVALKTIVDHQAPQDQSVACQGLIQP